MVMTLLLLILPLAPTRSLLFGVGTLLDILQISSRRVDFPLEFFEAILARFVRLVVENPLQLF